MRSIQSRLAAGLLLSLVILLLVQWVVVAVSIRHLSEQYISTRLIHTADLLVAAVMIDKSGKNISLDQSRIDPVFTTPFSGYYYQITANSQSFKSRSLWDQTLPPIEAKTGQFKSQRSEGPQDQQLLVTSSSYQKQGVTINISVAEDISKITHEINELLLNHALVSLFILIILIGIQVFIVRRSLLPLDKTRKDLQRLEEGEIQALDENVPHEIHSLVHEINIRIAAFQQRLERSRRATGNLAHALKAPLTILSHLMQDSVFQDKAEVRDVLQENIIKLQNIIDRELKRARLAGTAVAGRQTKIKTEVMALVQSLESMYREKNLRIEVNILDDCVANMDREDFHEMLGNVMDNACKWAKHTIIASFNCEQGLTIVVEDDGPGIPDSERDSIVGRGYRLDEQTAGHGLGLAIVKDIIDQYQGSISMSQSSALGGLRTELIISLRKSYNSNLLN